MSRIMPSLGGAIRVNRAKARLCQERLSLSYAYKEGQRFYDAEPGFF